MTGGLKRIRALSAIIICPVACAPPYLTIGMEGSGALPRLRGQVGSRRTRRAVTTMPPHGAAPGPGALPPEVALIGRFLPNRRKAGLSPVWPAGRPIAAADASRASVLPADCTGASVQPTDCSLTDAPAPGQAARRRRRARRYGVIVAAARARVARTTVTRCTTPACGAPFSGTSSESESDSRSVACSESPATRVR